MSKDAEYRRNAARTIDLASRAGTCDDKGRLLRMAEKWLDLADRTRRNARAPAGRIREHPLVRFALGSDPIRAE
jgi:hypothetical protein